MRTNERLGLAEFLNSAPIVSRREPLVQRWSRYELDSSMTSGDVIRLLPDIYAGARYSSIALLRAKAVETWAPGALITGSLALHLFAPDLPWTGRVDVLAHHGDKRRVPGWIAWHQIGVPRTSSAPQGVRTVVPERAPLDAWRYAAANERQDVVWEALWARACTWRQLAREVARHDRIPDRRRLMRMLEWFEAGATSPLEVRARFETFADARFREFEWQAPLAVPGRQPVADMLHRRARLVVELDGEKYHQAQADRERDIDLAAAGYQTIRFGWVDIARRPHWCREQVLRVVSARLAAQPRP